MRNWWCFICIPCLVYLPNLFIEIEIYILEAENMISLIMKTAIRLNARDSRLSHLFYAVTGSDFQHWRLVFTLSLMKRVKWSL